MKRPDASQHIIPNSDWQLLGELELPGGTGAQDAVCTWLDALLQPLRLYPDFQNKLLASAQDAVSRAMNSGSAEQAGYLHILVHAPVDEASSGQTWGFFRIEKIESRLPGQMAPDHAIEFYLYPEGR